MFSDGEKILISNSGPKLNLNYSLGFWFFDHIQVTFDIESCLAMVEKKIQITTQVFNFSATFK